MKVVYTFKARQDLKDIYEYITYTLLAPYAAKNTVGKIMEIIRDLEPMPERNAPYKDEPWHSQGVRFVPVKNYLVFYRSTHRLILFPLSGSCTVPVISQSS